MAAFRVGLLTDRSLRDERLVSGYQVLTVAMSQTGGEEQDWVGLVVGGIDHRLNGAYAVEHGAHMPILTPDNAQVKEAYRVQNVPFVFLLDKSGVIRARGVFNDRQHLDHLLTVASA